MNKTRTVLAAAASAVMVATSATATASTGESETVNAETFHQKVNEYALAHPGDFEGLNALAEELGGELTVSTSWTGPTTPETATRVQESIDAPDTSGEISPAAIPTDAFVVSVATARHPASTVASVSGTWNWRDEFVGQGPPVDIAALRFSDSCVIYGANAVSTYRWDNVSTDRGTLRSAGVGTGGPVWNIDAQVSGFANYADHGTVTQSVDLKECSGTVQTAFDYEGNDGGSVLSVSLGWGGLSVGYSNPDAVLQKSSAAATI